jgi:hypothetical protein
MKIVDLFAARSGRFAVAAALVAILFAASRVNLLAANVTASWTYDYGPQPACSPVQTINCLEHFEVEDVTDLKKIALIKKVDNPEHAVGKQDNISVTFKYGPPFGQRTISVIAVARDRTGKRITSDPFAACASAAIWPKAKLSLLF